MAARKTVYCKSFSYSKPPEGLIIIPLFITFGDKNYGNITIKIQNTTYYNYIHNQIKLSLAPLGINDCLCLTVCDTGILRCAGLVLQDLRLRP